MVELGVLLAHFYRVVPREPRKADEPKRGGGVYRRTFPPDFAALTKRGVFSAKAVALHSW